MPYLTIHFGVQSQKRRNGFNKRVIVTFFNKESALKPYEQIDKIKPKYHEINLFWSNKP